MKLLFPKCPVCGGEVALKVVEKLLRGGKNTALIKVKAEVCLHCGERLYSPDTVRKFEEVRRKLEEEKVKGLKVMGKSFKVA
ncbi:MAG TPA: YgiT-type zinc finger protein [Thermodesulfobacteriota bacterium]|nr:YgiT-type zinc finger protein [Thermodesulfobacteriota bacterium]